MAESQSMTTSEVIAKTMMPEHADFLREAVVAGELMEAEISAEIGAERDEVSPERQTHRNGSPPEVVGDAGGRTPRLSRGWRSRPRRGW